MTPVHVFGLTFSFSLATISACGHCYDGWKTCPVPTRIGADYRVLRKNFDAASYFPTGLYSTEPWWRGYEAVIPPEQRDPNDSILYRTALRLQGLGEESLYARRAEPGLHVYRVLVQSVFGGRGVWRAEERGLDAWVERRMHLGCKLHSDICLSTKATDYGFNVEMSEKELPAASWQAIDACMAEHFWTVPMVEAKPPTAPKPDEPLMADGPPFCLFEGVRGGEYHAIKLECEDSAAAPSTLLGCFAMIRSALR
jgi:hypothetical protein